LDYEIEDVDVIGKIMKIYYKSPDIIINAAQKKLNPKSVVQ